MGDSRYLLEPNVKEGKGGLRDLQTLFWIGRSSTACDDPAELVTQGVLTRRRSAASAAHAGSCGPCAAICTT